MSCGFARHDIQVTNTPAGITSPQAAIEGLVAGRRVLARAHEGAIEDQRPLRVEQRGRTREQTEADLPGRDVDDVRAEHGIEAFGADRPVLDRLGHVEHAGASDVAKLFRPSRDAREIGGFDIARLPAQVRPLAHEVGRVLTTAAPDLEHPVTVAQNFAQGRQNDIAVAIRGRKVETRIRVGHRGPSMPAKRVVIVGRGAQVSALIHAWLDHASSPALVWQTQADDATIERELGLAITRVGEGIEVAGRTITCVERAPELELVTIMVEGDRVRLQVADQAPIVFDPAPLLAIAPVLQALDRGPGLRWASLSILRGREGELAPLGVVEQSAAALEQAFARRLPALVGRLALGLARGPQLGTRLELVALLGNSTAQVVGDIIEHLARQAPHELRACSPSDSATVLGEGRMWIAERSQGIGPLTRIVAHFDAEALLASRVWARVASLA